MGLADAFCNSFGLTTSTKWADIYCPETKYTVIKSKFLWFGKKTVVKYKLHDYEVYHVGKWAGIHPTDYEVTIKCKDCGNIVKKFGLSKSELLHAGIDVDKEMGK